MNEPAYIPNNLNVLLFSDIDNHLSCSSCFDIWVFFLVILEQVPTSIVVKEEFFSSWYLFLSNQVYQLRSIDQFHFCFKVIFGFISMVDETSFVSNKPSIDRTALVSKIVKILSFSEGLSNEFNICINRLSLIDTNKLLGFELLSCKNSHPCSRNHRLSDSK